MSRCSLHVQLGSFSESGVSPCWFFLWLPEEVLTLLFLLHRENGDFSILMKDSFSESGVLGLCYG